MNDILDLKEKIKYFKVLFVDDEEEIRKGTGMLLSKFFDVVTICKNGQEGLEVFKKTKDFDIVIADIQMPKLSGIEMIKQIKEIKQDILTIFITASRGDAKVSKDLYDIYIKKPISYSDIKIILNKAAKLK